MESFEDLGVAPELVEALSREGIETPTPLQMSAIPVIRRGHDALIEAGPGGGTLVTYGIALLDRLREKDGPLGAIVIVPGREGADQLARSLARFATSVGRGVAALTPMWASPLDAHLLFATPSALLRAVGTSRIGLEGVEAIVVDRAAAIEEFGELESVGTLMSALPRGVQRILVSLPVTPGIERFGRSYLRKAARLPPPLRMEARKGRTERGTVHYRVLEGARESELVSLVADLLASRPDHALVFFADDDQAADVGDLLSLHGFSVGPPGDPASVWLATDGGEIVEPLAPFMARGEPIPVVSYAVPRDADALDRRHGAGRGGLIFLSGRELAHLRRIASEARYSVRAEPEALHDSVVREAADVRGKLASALEEEDLLPYILMMEPLLEEHRAIEVAAAALALLRRKGGRRRQGEVPPPLYVIRGPSPRTGMGSSLRWTRKTRPDRTGRPSGRHHGGDGHRWEKSGKDRCARDLLSRGNRRCGGPSRHSQDEWDHGSGPERQGGLRPRRETGAFSGEEDSGEEETPSISPAAPSV